MSKLITVQLTEEERNRLIGALLFEQSHRKFGKKQALQLIQKLKNAPNNLCYIGFTEEERAFLMFLVEESINTSGMEAFLNPVSPSMTDSRDDMKRSAHKKLMYAWIKEEVEENGKEIIGLAAESGKKGDMIPLHTHKPLTVVDYHTGRFIIGKISGTSALAGNSILILMGLCLRECMLCNFLKLRLVFRKGNNVYLLAKASVYYKIKIGILTRKDLPFLLYYFYLYTQWKNWKWLLLWQTRRVRKLIKNSKEII